MFKGWQQKGPKIGCFIKHYQDAASCAWMGIFRLRLQFFLIAFNKEYSNYVGVYKVEETPNKIFV